MKNFENPMPQQITNEWLEKQFENVETINIQGQEIKILDIIPPNQKTDIPVVMAPGYGTYSPLHIKTNILEMARLGRRTLFIDEPRGIKENINNEKTEVIKEYFLRQVSALVEVLDAKGIEKIDIVGNSEGGMYAIIAADIYPERFNNIILCNTGGMIGEDTASKLIYRFAVEGLRSAIDMGKRKKTMSVDAQKQIKEGVVGFNKYVFGEPKASYEEIKSMAGTKIRDMVKDVHSKGIGVSIIHTVDDSVFPMDQVQKETSKTSPDEKLIVDGFYSIPGRHGEFSVNPEQYTRITDEALTALEEKNKKLDQK